MNIRKITICALSGIVLFGCVKRDLEERPKEGTIEIELDWKDTPLPAEVCYLFYGQSGELVKKVIGPPQGITEKIATGTYHLAVYNCDAQQVGYRGLEQHNSAEVYALEKNATVKSVSGGDHIYQPLAVFGASSCLQVGELAVEQNKTLRRTAEPVPLTKQVRFLFTVINAIQVDALTGVLNGIAPSVSLTSGKSSFAKICSTPFTGVRGEGDAYTIDINVFDLLASEQQQDNSNTMDIALEADGKQYEFNTDLTSILEDIIEENGGVIPIEIPIEIEITIKEINGGIDATVKPWDNGGTGSGDPRPTKR